jgi:hypothetical protein
MVAGDVEAISEVEIGTRLAGARVLEIQRVGGGRNSRVSRITTSAGIFALKQYPPLSDDPRDRLATETRALAWMAEHGVDVVPRVIALERATNYALLSWVEGALVSEVGARDVDQASAFLGEVERLRRSFDFPSPQLASEACLSGVEIERQIRARMSRLDALDGEPALEAFLGREFSQRFEQLLSGAKTRLSSAGLSFATELPADQRTLVPSDFGFHNALRGSQGCLTFIDFEYFGWDDPVKLVSDSLLHPGTPMTQAMRSRVRSAMQGLYSHDPGFPARFAAFFPLFGLRWVLILLNEFHPERWRRRVLAGDTEGWQQAKERQLRAARAMLAELGGKGIE